MLCMTYIEWYHSIYKCMCEIARLLAFALKPSGSYSVLEVEQERSGEVLLVVRLWRAQVRTQTHTHDAIADESASGRHILDRRTRPCDQPQVLREQPARERRRARYHARRTVGARTAGPLRTAPINHPSVNRRSID